MKATIILAFIVVLAVMPGALAEKLDIAITDVCYFEKTDQWGTKGIIVPFVLENKGDVPIVNPRVDFFLNDGMFPEDKYPKGFHTGYTIYGLDYYKRIFQPGEVMYEENATFFFAYYAYYPNDLYRGSKIKGRIVADWLNELNESDETNNEVEFSITLNETNFRKCNLNSATPPAINLPNDTVSNSTVEVNETPVTPIPSNDTINNTTDLANASYAELIEKDIRMYRYLSSSKHSQSYGTVYTAYYARDTHRKSEAAANVVVFENEKQAVKYLSDKIKNSESSDYERGRGVYFLRNPSDSTFIWVHGNYAVSVSGYGKNLPEQIFRAYLEKYPGNINNWRK